MRYKFLEHTADVKIRAEGITLEKAFENSALALKDVIFDFEKIKIKEKLREKINVKGRDWESLLYNFLEEFLYLLDAKDFIFGKIIKLKIKGNKLEAEAVGDKAGNYNFVNKVKAVTYNEMFVRKLGKKWVCQVVIDV